MAINSFKIRNFITAKSPKRLRRLMYEKQISLGMAALEFDQITYAKGNWYAWYYEILKSDNQSIQDISEDGITENNRR